jgi:hypothetical protein
MVKRKQKLEWKPVAKSKTNDWSRLDTILVLAALVLLGVYIWLN